MQDGPFRAKSQGLAGFGNPARGPSVVDQQRKCHRHPASFADFAVDIELALVALALGTVLGAYVGPALQHATSRPSQPAASAASPEGAAAGQIAAGTVGALGRLMPQGDTTTLAPPFGAGDARVARWLISEGRRVTVGQVIAELDNLPQRLALRAISAAELAAKQAALAKARSEARLGWAEAQAASSRAHAARLVATQDLERISALVQVGVTTQAQLDQARAMVA